MIKKEIIMSKKFYAGRHVLGREFSYESGWTVYVFDSKKDRDNWVYEMEREDYQRGYSPRSEAISRDIARRIAGSRVKEVWNEDGTVGRLEEDNGYYNPHYWG
jgi:hypothetical protein